MSIDKFASFSSTKRSYFVDAQPKLFMGISKESRLLSYYKKDKIRHSATCVHSGEPIHKPVTLITCDPNRNNNVMQANAMVVTGPAPGERTMGPMLEEAMPQDYADGIGITKFLKEKSFLVTGATGFLSKVFVEKMLRTAPNIHKIYLLIRAKDKDDAMKRLKTEILDLELFKNLKEIHGNSFEEFVMSKLVPVVGNVCEPNLGINPDSAYEIENEVYAIVNSAAITTFDERYDVALDVNTRGPCRVVSFAKKCKKLKVLLHFSTAFANRDKNVVIFEEPLYLAKGEVVAEDGPKLISQIDIEAEIELAQKSRVSFQPQNETPKLKELGLNRARFYGWPNTYSFTKAMGEMLINDQRGDVPLVIMRPSIIESTYSEPFPGWIQGNRVMDPHLIHYGKGQLQGVLADPEGYLNIVPADMVANASLAAMSKHGIETKPGINLYHVVSSATKPLRVRAFFNFVRDYFVSYPFTDSEGKELSISEMKYFSKMDEFSTFLLGGKKDIKVDEMTRWKRKMKPLLHISKIYEPYMFHKECLESVNTKKLIEYMSGEEKEKFQFDFERINWEDYMLKVHIPGVKKHVLKGRETIQTA